MRWRSACQPKKSRLSCLSALMSIASNPFRYRRASDFERGFLVGAVLLRTIMDISARAFSLADRPQRAIRVTSVRMRREDRSSISSYPLADLGG